jgi:hypothetical protein
VHKVIGFVGFKSAGKDTVANYLMAKHNYSTIAFADGIKDCLSSIFSWDRAMLEGDTPESRAWREQVDPWWAEKLGIPDFSPRWAMTNFGTDLMRTHFNPRVWILNTDRRLLNLEKQRVIVKDCRFPNEIEAVRERGGVIVRIRRGPEPYWFNTAARANLGDTYADYTMSLAGVHESEWRWIGEPIDFLIDNDGTLDDLCVKVEETLVA